MELVLKTASALEVILEVYELQDRLTDTYLAGSFIVQQYQGNDYDYDYDTFTYVYKMMFLACRRYENFVFVTMPSVSF